jgi:kinesin family protein 20
MPCWLLTHKTYKKSQVMIVNVNPYDTGFDENSHVMKFAALAREVTTTRKPAPPAKKGTPAGTSRPSEQHRRKVTISMGKPGRQSEALLEVLEGEILGRNVSTTFLTHTAEDEEADDLDDTDEDFELNKAFVSALFDEIDELRMRVRISYPVVLVSIYQIVLAI